MEEIGYRIRQKKQASDNYVYRDVPKVCRESQGLIIIIMLIIMFSMYQGKSEFKVDDLQSSTTYSFNILAFNTKGESDYTTDKVQKSTVAQQDTSTDSSSNSPSSPSPMASSYSQLLIIISSVGGALLLCNLGLLYCYLRRRGSDTMSRSSILEMYFSSTSSNQENSDYDSQSVGSESESELESRERVRRWRYDSPPPSWSQYR